ncbi:MAG: S8 family serine peptidase [Saprospiraceae bacterium]|nr:S8 family serine peptidase [Saprospiraceae bacterium]
MYKVKYGGKKGKTIELVESPDMVVIRTKDNQQIEEVAMSRKSRELIKETTEVAAFPEAGVTVRRVAPTEGLESVSAATAQRDETRAALKEEENIRFAGRVLQDADSGEVMLYTENFFVKFLDKTSEEDCLAVLTKYNLKIKNKLPFAPNSYFVEASEGTGLKVFEMAEKILEEKNVEYCHPELVQERRYKVIHKSQWHLAKTTIKDKTVDAHVNIEAAWAQTRGKGVTIAVIDDGIEIDHPEFKGRIVHAYDATTNTTDPRPQAEGDNHGTACAGMACAAGLKDGASGTAPEAFLMPIRLRSGLGSMAEANAFAWAADHGADVISCSWGPTDGEWWNPSDPVHNRSTPLPDSTRLALDYALNKGRNGKGCVILFAAGNGNEDTVNDGYSSYPGVIAVTACNDTGRRSVYSDFGDAVWVCFPSGDFGWKPFSHPAPISTGLRTVDRLSKGGYQDGDYTDTFGGTSGACPGMAGVVGLMLAANADLTSKQVKELIKKSCTRIDEGAGEYDSNGHSIYYGFGRIDAGLAVKNALDAKAPAAGSVPQIEGSVKFSPGGDVPLMAGQWAGDFKPARKIVGMTLRLKSAQNGLKIRYKTNVAGVGIVQSKKEGEYVGGDSKKRLLGFAAELEGANAAKYELEYAVRLKGQTKPVVGKNGALCGTDQKSGKTIEAISITVRKK